MAATDIERERGQYHQEPIKSKLIDIQLILRIIEAIVD
jgi:hypothetical protein